MPIYQLPVNSGLEPDELQSIVAHVNNHYAGSYENVPYTSKSLENLARKGLVLVLREGGLLKGVLVSTLGARGHFIKILALPADPDVRIMEALLFGLESRVKNGIIYSWVEPDKLKVWKTLGYKQSLCWDHMIAPLRPVGASHADRQILLRELRSDEESDLVDMVNSSFGRERIKNGCIAKWKEEYGDFDEGWIHVAEVGGRMVSAVVSAPDKEYNMHYGKRRGYLGPAATLPEFQSRGIAGSLVMKAMNFLYSKGMESVSLYTAESNYASQTLLRKLGFKSCHRWTEMCKVLGGDERSY